MVFVVKYTGVVWFLVSHDATRSVDTTWVPKLKLLEACYPYIVLSWA